MQASSSQCHLPHMECLDLSDWSDLDDIKKAINDKLWSLLNPQSGEGEGN